MSWPASSPEPSHSGGTEPQQGALAAAGAEARARVDAAYEPTRCGYPSNRAIGARRAYMAAAARYRDELAEIAAGADMTNLTASVAAGRVVNGGQNAAANLVTSCWPCNSGKCTNILDQALLDVEDDGWAGLTDLPVLVDPAMDAGLGVQR